MASSFLGKARSLLALNRGAILLVVSLLFTWSVAHIFPKYQDTIRDTIADRLARTREKIPAVKIDFHPETDPRTAYNSSKLAVLIEARPIPHLVPQLLHMMTVVPPDWRFLFIGSNRSVIHIGRSFGAKFQQATGKLDLMVAPKPWTIDSKEDVFRMLTDVRFYDELLPGVEWMLKFESDSIMCANSVDSLNDWLDYHWAGAPRTENDQFAGNGGLSLRRISAVRQVLAFQQRTNNSDPEDEWFGKRIAILPGLKVATGEQEEHFSVEEVWHEQPMGYHVRDTGGGALAENVWKNPDQRKRIYDYCPEVAIIMPMKLERERCEGDDREGHLLDPPPPEKRRENDDYVPAFRSEMEYLS
ncbi:MAG: hypothetical protein M1818_000142 [Claussenomyces sp. TS43310]|nr:MAG: hypothetical protein M1818_000142 [Claussenomyces sp. TS43310]